MYNSPNDERTTRTRRQDYLLKHAPDLILIGVPAPTELVANTITFAALQRIRRDAKIVSFLAAGILQGCMEPSIYLVEAKVYLRRQSEELFKPTPLKEFMIAIARLQEWIDARYVLVTASDHVNLELPRPTKPEIQNAHKTLAAAQRRQLNDGRSLDAFFTTFVDLFARSSTIKLTVGLIDSDPFELNIRPHIHLFSNVVDETATPTAADSSHYAVDRCAPGLLLCTVKGTPMILDNPANISGSIEPGDSLEYYADDSRILKHWYSLS